MVLAVKGKPSSCTVHTAPATAGESWGSHRGLRAVLVLVVGAAIATTVGVVALWPTGEGIEAARASAAEIGLASDRFGATVREIRDGRCSYSAAENPYYCRQVTVVLDEGPAQGSPVALPELELAFVATVPSLAVGQRVILGYEPSTDYYSTPTRIGGPRSPG